MRLVLVDAKARTYAVYEGKRRLAVYQLGPDESPLSTEEIEAMRTLEQLPGVA